MKIRIKNYQAIKKAELEFDPGVTVIVGNSNNGKSSIIRSIEAAINNKGGSGFINYDADASQVTIEDNGQSVMWHKNRNSAKSFYQLNDRTLNKIGQKQLEEVGQLLNMPEVVINNEKFRLNFWKQLDYPFLVGSTHYQLFEFISKSKDQELIANLLNETTSRMKDSNAELNDLNAQINLRTKDVSETEAEIKKLEVFETFDAVNFSRLNRTMETIEENLDVYNMASEEINTLGIKVSNIEAKIKKIEMLSTEVRQKLLLSRSLENYINASTKETELKNDVVKKESKVKKLELLLSEFKTSFEKMDKIEKALFNHVNHNLRIDALKEMINALDGKEVETQKELDQFEVCPFCFNAIKDHGGVAHD